MRTFSTSLVSSVRTALMLSLAVAGVAAFAGCSDDETPPVVNRPTDAGATPTDASVTIRDASAPVDATTAADASPVIDGSMTIEDAQAPTCTNDASLDSLDVPDAAVADGGFDPATCVACTKSACATEYNNCNGECACREAVSSLLACLASGSAPIACAGGIDFESSQHIQAFGGCVVGSCANECGLGGLGAPESFRNAR